MNPRVRVKNNIVNPIKIKSLIAPPSDLSVCNWESKRGQEGLEKGQESIKKILPA
jgi:hypothetical protein